jgi:tetratricopeptide (TPR) repeat protein
MPETLGKSIGKGCVPPERLHEIAGGSGTHAEHTHIAACSHCGTYLRQVREDAQFAAELASAVGKAPAAKPSAPTPRIEGFEVRGEIHRGAQGVVYEAWQESTKRLVAVKVPAVSGALTTRQLARFEREIELAASISHPAVVAIHASGLTGDGRPYIAMELVNGQLLDDYARSLHESDPKAARRVLALFAEVCRGVDAAHQRGIIHRDLKPANILVDAQGHPRVLDFGVARLHEEQTGQTVTREGDFVGTLAYAAPEQLSNRRDAVDIRTDVYALGVIAYELVTGQRPHMYVDSVAGLVKAITELPVPTPRIKDRPVDRELRTVLLTALSKDPARRYASAAALAEDMERYLQGRPLRARGDGLLYPARMALKRHPYMAAGVVAVVVMTIGGGAALVRSEFRARWADQTTAAVGNAILEAAAQVDPDSDELRAPVDELNQFLKQAVAITREELKDYPLEQTNLLMKLAKAYANRKQLPMAQSLLEEAVEIRQGALPEGHVDIARARLELGQLLRQRDDRAAARRELTAARADLRRTLGDEHPDTLECMHRLAELLIRDREYEEARGLMEIVIAGRERAPKPDYLKLCESWAALAHAQRGLCEYEESVKNCRQVLEKLKYVKGEDSREEASTLELLVANLISLRREAEAEPLAKEAVRIRGKWYPPKSVQYALGLMQLASVKRRLGGEARTEEQKKHLHEARDLARQVLGARLEAYGDKDHELVAEARSMLGRILTRLGELAEAEVILRIALETRQRLRSGADQRNIARSEAYLGDCLASAGKTAVAEPLLRHAVEVLKATPGCQNAGELADATERLAVLFEGTGRTAEAAALRSSLAPDQR